MYIIYGSMAGLFLFEMRQSFVLLICACVSGRGCRHLGKGVAKKARKNLHNSKIRAVEDVLLFSLQSEREEMMLLR